MPLWRRPQLLSLPRHQPARSLALAGIAAVFLVAATGCHRSGFPVYPSNYREFAYVTNGGSDTVSVIDLVNLRSDRVVQAGQQPTGVAASPTRNEVYIVNSGRGNSNGSLSILNTESNHILTTIPLHRQPYFVSVDAEGKRAYVANSGSNNISVIDLDRRREIAVAGAGEQPGLAVISPDSRSLVATNRGSGSISIYAVSDDATQPLRLRTVLEGCPGATDAVILPDSSKAFIACSSGHQVMAIQLATTASAATAPATITPDAATPARPAAKDLLLDLLDVGKTPVHLAMKPDGGEIFVSNFDGNSISEIDTSANEVGGTYMIGEHPVRGIVSADNSTLWVANFGADSVSAYSIDDGKVTDNVRTGSAPDALALSAAGNLLLAVDSRSGDVAVIRTQARSDYQSRSLFTLLPAGVQPNAIVVKAFLVKK